MRVLQSGMIPNAAVGGGEGPGCFTHLKGQPITRSQLWWWETIMTFTLVSVVYATAVTKPGHGSLAPLAIGFTLFASAFVGALLLHSKALVFQNLDAEQQVFVIHAQMEVQAALKLIAAADASFDVNVLCQLNVHKRARC